MGMRWKAAVCILAAALLVLMGFAGCGGEAEGEKVVVKIGLTAPLSGIGAGYGQDIKAGLDMAIADVNSKGGIKIGDTTYVFELVSADDEMVPEKALSNAQRFVLEEDIKIIWDPTANTIQSLMGINETAGEEFLIMGYTSVPLYAQKPNKYMVTLPPPFSVYVKDWITRALTKGWKKLGMLQTTGAYGELWGKTFKDAWTKAGGTVVAEAPASYYTETDFTPYLTTVLAANPDVIFCGGPSEPTALVIDQARNQGFKGGFIVIDQAKLDIIEETTGIDKLEGCIGVLPVDQSQWTATLETMERFEKEYNRRFTWEAAICYTGFHILVKAMEEAGSVDDVAAIRAAFAKGNVSVTSGEELPVEYAGINDQTGALFMPGTSVIVMNGAYQPGEPIEWWKQ